MRKRDGKSWWVSADGVFYGHGDRDSLRLAVLVGWENVGSSSDSVVVAYSGVATLG